MTPLSQVLRILPNGPLLFRDARPFSAGSTGARTLSMPLPSVIAGTVRTLLGRQEGLDFSQDAHAQQVRGWKVYGPLVHIDGKRFFPSPADAFVANDRVLPMLPMKDIDGSTDLPDKLVPVGLAAPEGKPQPGPDLWAEDELMKWLAGKPLRLSDLERTAFCPEIDRRTHLQMGDTGTAADGMLFATEGVSLLRKSGGTIGLGEFLARVDGAPALKETVHRIGGEGRFAGFTSDAGGTGVGPWPMAPQDDLLNAIGGCPDRIRLQLATPAIFESGWCPGWLKATADGYVGSPPGSPPGTSLRLVAACVPRWKPLAGWDLAEARRHGAGKGHKPLRRLVPAGASYFFVIGAGSDSAKALAEHLWLKPVSDEPQDRNDGFGLALWGTWNYQNESKQGGNETC